MKKEKFNGVRVSKDVEGGRSEAAFAPEGKQSKQARRYNGSSPIMKNNDVEQDGRRDKAAATRCQNERRGKPAATKSASPMVNNGKLDGGRTPEVDAKSLWKGVEDVVAPQRQLSVIDHVIYFHLLRHSRLEGKRQLRFSIPWLAHNIRLSVCPTREGVRRLAAEGVLRLVHRSKAGHVVEVLLPEEIPGIHSSSAEIPNEAGARRAAGMEDIDFTKTRELRRAIHAREGGKCFYCLRKIDARLECLDHVVPRVKLRCNSYRNLVSVCMECNSQKGERPAEEYLRWLFRDHRLGAAELRDRFRALQLLASGGLRPALAEEGERGSPA